MKKITQALNSPIRIGVFALLIVALCGVIVFTTMNASAKANEGKTIGMDKGVDIALEDAGFKADQVTGLTAHYDNDDGVATYDVEFIAGESEYDYSIKASDGSIIEASREKADKNSNKDKEDGKVDSDVASQNKDTDNNGGSESVKPQTSNAGSSGSSSGNSDNSNNSYIGIEKAKSIALKNAGLSASSVKFTKAKMDRDDGRVVYEIEFFSGSKEYEYEIGAISGKILEKDIEHDDYDDDDYDDDDDDDDEYDD